MVKRPFRKAAVTIALVGIMAATLECAKLALASLPNVEAVTLLTALYGYVFGPLGILASVVFVCIEPMIWGVGTWIISYIIYWPAVAAVFMLLGRLKIKRRFAITSIAVILTFLFGILTSLVDIGLFTGNYENFIYRFGIYYARGVYFYLTQIICNAILFPLVFPSLSRSLFSIGRKILK